MKKVIMLIAVVMTIAACSSGPAEPVAKTNDTAKESSGVVATTPETKWQYEEAPNKMSGKTDHYAAIEANDQMDFKPPYGTVTATILVMHRDGKSNVLLRISEGQFLPNIGDGRTIRAKFDDAPAQSYGYSNPTDFSSTDIFIDNSKKFLANLKKAKKVIIESEFYNEGIRTMEFDVAGFDWKYIN